MTILPTRWRSAIGVAATMLAAAALGITLSAPTPAAARVFVGFGVPIGFPGYYRPYPYYPPPPYYYPPPPPASYPSSAGYPPPAGYGGSGASAAPSITYTRRRGWTDAQGQYCREYKATQGTAKGATERYGTACRDESGQWRIVN